MNNKKLFSGISYWAAVLNPFSDYISTQDDATGLKFLAYKKDVIGRTLFKTGGYDRFLSDWLIQRFSKTDGNFIDIGANLGYFTCLLSRLAGDKGRVLSFEPEPKNFELLQKNIKINSLQNIDARPIALGAETGKATLNIYKESNRGRHSIVAPGSGRSIQVPLCRLDDVVSEAFGNTQKISFLKIDVEGYEPFVIKGGCNTLDRVDAMAIEYAPYLLSRIISSQNELEGFLKTLEKKFSKVYEISANSITQITFAEIRYKKDALDLLLEK